MKRISELSSYVAGLEGTYRPTGFLRGSKFHINYLIELKGEYVGRWEWEIRHSPTGELVAKGAAMTPQSAARDVRETEKVAIETFQLARFGGVRK